MWHGAGAGPGMQWVEWWGWDITPSFAQVPGCWHRAPSAPCFPLCLSITSPGWHPACTVTPAEGQSPPVPRESSFAGCRAGQRALPRAGSWWRKGRVAGLSGKGVRQLRGSFLRNWEQAGRADFAHPGKQTARIALKQSPTPPSLADTTCRALNFGVFVLGQKR